jgi:hypothetical protein
MNGMGLGKEEKKKMERDHLIVLMQISFLPPYMDLPLLSYSAYENTNCFTMIGMIEKMFYLTKVIKGESLRRSPPTYLIYN